MAYTGLEQLLSAVFSINICCFKKRPIDVVFTVRNFVYLFLVPPKNI